MAGTLKSLASPTCLHAGSTRVPYRLCAQAVIATTLAKVWDDLPTMLSMVSTTEMEATDSLFD